MAEFRASTVQQRREEVYAALQYLVAFIFWWRNGKTVKTFHQNQKGSVLSWTIMTDGVVCTTKQISLHEMLKKQQQDNIAKKM